MVTTNDISYHKFIHPRVKIKSSDGFTTNYTFDAFNPGASNIIFNNMDVENSTSESGLFNIWIEDYENNIEYNLLKNSKVFIELGKDSASYQHFLIGFTDIARIVRPQSNRLAYNLTGFGTKIRAAELFVNVVEASEIKAVDDLTAVPDANFNINNIFKKVMTRKNYRPLQKETIVDLTGWRLDGISDKADINVPVLNHPYTYLNQFADDLCNVGGYDWFIDYSTGEEIFFVSQPEQLHTGVTIKSGDLKVDTIDDATKTSYITSAFNAEDDSSLEIANATRLITTSTMESESVTSSFLANGATSTTNKAIAQQFALDVNSRRIGAVAFVFTKVGNPRSIKDFLYTRLILDNNNKPTGPTVLQFNMVLETIDTTKDTITFRTSQGRPLTPLDPSLFVTGTTKFWFVVFQRSGTSTTSDSPNTDESNTVWWHHSNVFNQTQPFLSGTAVGGDINTPLANMDWKTTNQGPTYAYGIFATIRRLQSKTNISAKSVGRLKEAYIDTSFLSDSKSTDLYLTNLLDISAKARRGIPSFMVTIPNNFIFRPYQYVDFADTKSNVSGTFQVQRVHYVLDAKGTRECELTLGNSINPVYATFNCDS